MPERDTRPRIANTSNSRTHVAFTGQGQSFRIPIKNCSLSQSRTRPGQFQSLIS